MPPTRVATASGRKTTNRAASVPASQGDSNSGPGSLRLEKSKPSRLDVREDMATSDLPSIVLTCGRKHDSPPSVTVPIAGATEQRPQKRRKRSSSTPAAPRSSQLPTQLQSRRLLRSRVGPPTADVNHSSDIYMHLADPNGTGNLLSEPPAGSVTLSTLDELVGSRSVKQPRGRRKKAIDLADENTKKNLMEEWARIRRFQGALPHPRIDDNACFSQMLLRDTQRCESVSSVQLEAMTRRNAPDADLVKNGTAVIVNIPQSQETVLDAPPRCSSTPMDFEDVLPAGTDASRERPDRNGAVLPSGGRTERPVVSSVDMEAPSTSIRDSHVGKASSSGELAGVPETAHYLDLLQCSESPPLALSTSTSRESFVRTSRTNLTKLRVNETVDLDNSSKNNHSETSQIPSDSSNIHLDFNEEFCMLDIPEIFTLPWVPVSSHLYVPPSLGKLISGMREQLTIEARTRRRAEELYQVELGRRISAEKIIEDLRTELEAMQKDPSAR